ncbi:MAG: YjfB family protein [Oscillospiraceae bacterium]|nr:YjfB family protein [Oscillospiraceae bacterium]
MDIEMSIAAMSMSMAQANMQDALAVGMLKKTMESSEASMDMLTDMIDNMPSPDGRGTILNTLA